MKGSLLVIVHIYIVGMILVESVYTKLLFLLLIIGYSWLLIKLNYMEIKK